MTISFLGPIRRPGGVALSTTVSVDEGATVESLLATLGYDASERRRLRVLASGRPLALSELLGANDEVTLFLPLGGG